MTKLPIALQLYTVRDEIARDFAGTLRQVADIGYRSVELAGYGGLAAGEMKSLLDSLGLGVAGSHVGLDALDKDIEGVIAYNTTIGNRYVVCPWLPEERLRNVAACGEVAGAFNRIGERLKAAGLSFAYHNHAFEFKRVEGDVYAYDVLMNACDPALVKIEMDTFWVKKGGEEPGDYLRKYAGRVPLIHLKDMTPGADGTFAEVGEGVMDFDAIFNAAGEAGGEYYIVEQDRCQRPPLESVRISFENLKKMGMV